MDLAGINQIGTFEQHSWEKKENPQTYCLQPSYGENPRPSQHMLGIVGGNEVPYKNRQLQVELESDLRGITRPNTFCPQRQHQFIQSPANVNEMNTNTVGIHPSMGFTKPMEIVRTVPKQNVKIPVVTQPLKQSQMWAYPATIAPEPFMIETCARPEKY